MTQALLEKQKNRHTKCSQGRDHNLITDRHMAKSDQEMVLLLFIQQGGVSFRNQPFTLSAVGPWRRLRKMQSITMAEERTMEEPGSCCFLVQVKSGAVTSTWVESSAPMVGMVAQEGISAGSLEVGMDEVGKAHGTSVCTLLEEDGRAPWPDADGDAYAHADVDVDADGKTSFLGRKESEWQTDSIVHNKVLFFH